MMNIVLAVLLIFSFVTAAFTGRMEELSSAALSGCGEAVTLAISLTGMLCLWSGLMEIASRCRLTEKLAVLFRPVTRLLFPSVRQGSAAMSAICMNLSANLLGLGNAATPLGIRAACAMARGCGGTASDELCRLVVLNTASIQLLPTTVAAVRSACGCRTPLDILPAVWLSSALSVAAGLGMARLLGRVWR